MFNLLTALFFSIGVVVTAFGTATFFYSMSERLRADRARKQAHDKRVVTLLEAIDQKLNTKP
jgi:hypothetical protein